MPQKERTLIPSRRYDLQLKIKGLDYSNDLYRLRLTSSVNSPYQIVSLDMFIDPNDIILERIFGRDPLKLNIRLLGDVEYISEQIDLELMYIKGGFQLGMKNEYSEIRQSDRSSFNIIAVCRNPFKTITYPVNEVYLDTTIEGILEDLVSKSGSTLQIDKEGLNDEKIDQIIVPSTTLYKSIQYLDRRFGIFRGACVVFCRYDNKLFIKNITSKTKMNQTFTVYQLASDSPDNTKIISSSLDGHTFYTYDKIDTRYSNNVKFSVAANIEKYIMTPKDQLYYVLEKNLKDICSENGVIYQNKNVEFDSILEQRETSIKDPCAYETSDTFVVAKMSKYIANMSTVSVNLERNLPILNLINIGEAVKLVCKTVEYIDVSGKYILKSTDIDFRKEKDWQCVAKLDLIRTNQTI